MSTQRQTTRQTVVARQQGGAYAHGGRAHPRVRARIEHGRTPAARRPARPSRSRPGRSRRAGLVSIIVPAKDEAAAIGRTLRGLPIQTLRAAGFEVETIVLDGRSSDGTRDIARRHGARVVTDRGEGKGAAVREARAALRGEYVVMLDADGSYAPDAIPRLLSPLAWGEADIVMGDRQVLAGSMKPVHRFGNVMLSLGASILYGRACRDVCTGLWAFRASALHDLPLQARGFELEAEMFALSARMGLRVAHVPVDYLPREGTAKLSASRDGLRIGWCLVRSRFSGRPRPRREAGEADADAAAGTEKENQGVTA